MFSDPNSVEQAVSFGVQLLPGVMVTDCKHDGEIISVQAKQTSAGNLVHIGRLLTLLTQTSVDLTVTLFDGVETNARFDPPGVVVELPGFQSARSRNILGIDVYSFIQASLSSECESPVSLEEIAAKLPEFDEVAVTTTLTQHGTIELLVDCTVSKLLDDDGFRWLGMLGDISPRVEVTARASIETVDQLVATELGVLIPELEHASGVFSNQRSRVYQLTSELPPWKKNAIQEKVRLETGFLVDFTTAVSPPANVLVDQFILSLEGIIPDGLLWELQTSSGGMKLLTSKSIPPEIRNKINDSAREQSINKIQFAVFSSTTLQAVIFPWGQTFTIPRDEMEDHRQYLQRLIGAIFPQVPIEIVGNRFVLTLPKTDYPLGIRESIEAIMKDQPVAAEIQFSGEFPEVNDEQKRRIITEVLRPYTLVKETSFGKRATDGCTVTIVQPEFLNSIHRQPIQNFLTDYFGHSVELVAGRMSPKIANLLIALPRNIGELLVELVDSAGYISNFDELMNRIRANEITTADVRIPQQFRVARLIEFVEPLIGLNQSGSRHDTAVSVECRPEGGWVISNVAGFAGAIAQPGTLGFRHARQRLRQFGVGELNAGVRLFPEEILQTYGYLSDREHRLALIERRVVNPDGSLGEHSFDFGWVKLDRAVVARNVQNHELPATIQAALRIQSEAFQARKQYVRAKGFAGQLPEVALDVIIEESSRLFNLGVAEYAAQHALAIPYRVKTNVEEGSFKVRYTSTPTEHPRLQTPAYSFASAGVRDLMALVSQIVVVNHFLKRPPLPKDMVDQAIVDYRHFEAHEQEYELDAIIAALLGVSRQRGGFDAIISQITDQDIFLLDPQNIFRFPIVLHPDDYFREKSDCRNRFSEALNVGDLIPVTPDAYSLLHRGLRVRLAG